MSFYEVKVVDMDGDVLATFQTGGDEDASVQEVTWELNEPGSARFTIPNMHPDAAEAQALVREVQVFRGGELIHWGPLVQREYGAGAVTWTSPGLLWYLTRRFFGPISIQFLTNPNFESDLSGWTAVGPDLTASQETNLRIRGPGTARLVATASGENYLEQTFEVDTGGIGLVIAIAGWYWIDPTVTFQAPAQDEIGLYVSAPDALPDPTPVWEPITMNATVGKPERIETGIQLAADLTDEPVTVRLYAPWGAIQWGATSATVQESVSSEPEGTDVTEMMRRIVDYAQNGTGKSGLNIGTDTDAAGVTETVAYQFFDLGNIFAALQTYPARGLADYDVVFDETTRTFMTYAPTKGTLKAGNALVVPGEQVLSLNHRLDGQQTATKVIRRAPGDGSDRELGVATDTGPLGGLVLEDVGDAPLEVTVDGLDQFAAVDLARLSEVVALPDVTVPAEGWIGVVFTGDTVPVTIDWGAVQDTADRRVVRMTLDPKSDTVTVGFNVDAG